MATQSQIEANQRNAKKSTGPTSLLGKKRSSMNAVTHGILSKVMALPGEDETYMVKLRENILNDYQPQDTMERCLVDRIIMAVVRQIRLVEAEAAKLRISMRSEILADSITQVLRSTTLRRFKAQELKDEVEYSYQYLFAITEELEPHALESLLPSLSYIEKNMPKTFGFLKEKAESYQVAWEDFTKDVKLVAKALREIKKDALDYVKLGGESHLAYSLLEDMKIIHRIPQGVDLSLMSRYQVQLDNDLYRAMDALQKYRDSKAKLIEGEIIEDEEGIENLS